METLDNIVRDIDSKVVRDICTAIRRGENDFYENPLSDHVWRDYRKKCGIKGKPKKLSRFETFKLILCAKMHRDNRRNITSQDINRELLWQMNNAQGSLEKIFERLLTAQSVKGYEIPALIKLIYQRDVSDKTLYRWGYENKTPKFHAQKTYSVYQVRQFLKAAA